MIVGGAQPKRAHDGALAQTMKAFIASPTGVAAGLVLLALTVIAIIGPFVWGDAAIKLDLSAAQRGPSIDHLFGTDRLGRDYLARVLVATRLSLGLGFAGALLGALIGIPIGMGVALAGPRLSDVGRRLIDLWLTFPYLLVVIFLSAVVSSVGTIGALFAVGVASAPYLARLTSNLAASIGGRDYVLAARSAGIGVPRVLFRHVFPNIADTLSIAVLALVGSSIIAFSSLSFLGIGVQPPAFDWGLLLTQGVRDIFLTPLAAVGPGVMIAVTGLAAGYLGEGLAHASNPLVWTSSTRPDARAPQKATTRATPNRTSRPFRTGSAHELLRVDNLSVSFPFGHDRVRVVDEVSLHVGRGEVVGLVGESGSGKTLTALALAGLVPYPAVWAADRLDLDGTDLLTRGSARDTVLATGIGMIFQDPMLSLNPSLRIGTQLIEGARRHRHLGRVEAAGRAVDLMREMHISAPEMRMRQYPHEVSGGTRQRIMIAMALMNDPSLIIADEPTSSIDVTVQAQIMALLKDVNVRNQTAILLISHDIALVSSICSRILVMYAGHIVEEIPAALLNAGAAEHPYTRALVKSIPNPSGGRDDPLVGIQGHPPTFADLPSGCPFRPRCPLAVDRCSQERPDLLPTLAAGQSAACWVVHSRSA
jgi:peptide/nickel transport system permease protein